MKLYRIRRKSDRHHLVQFWGARTPSQAYWNESGVFWKTIDTVVKHLRSLCVTEYNFREPNIYDYSLADQYEIIITDVTVNNETSVPAADYIKQEAA